MGKKHSEGIGSALTILELKSFILSSACNRMLSWWIDMEQRICKLNTPDFPEFRKASKQSSKSK